MITPTLTFFWGKLSKTNVGLTRRRSLPSLHFHRRISSPRTLSKHRTRITRLLNTRWSWLGTLRVGGSRSWGGPRCVPFHRSRFWLSSFFADPWLLALRSLTLARCTGDDCRTETVDRRPTSSGVGGRVGWIGEGRESERELFLFIFAASCFFLCFRSLIFGSVCSSGVTLGVSRSFSCSSSSRHP